MPAGYGIGDHRLFVIDFTTQDIIGVHPPKIIRPTSRRLNTALPGVAIRYTDKLDELILRHRLIERMGKAHVKSKSRKSFAKRINHLDRELGDYMRYAEKKCRKIKLGRIQFSPEAAMWIKRTQVYKSLLRYHAGRIRNRGNLKRAARRCGIEHPLSLPIREIYLRLQTCETQCDHFQKHGKYYRRKHLYNRLNAARERDNDEVANKILLIIEREKDRSFWRRMNYALGKPHGGACFKVQVEKEDGELEEFTESPSCRGQSGTTSTKSDSS
jgi:hypothetical protein